MNVKKMMFKYTTILTLVIMGQGCDFLEVDPIGKTTIPVFFSDMDGIRAAVPGAYSVLYEFYGSEMLLYPEVAGNMVSLNTLESGSKMYKQYNFISEPEDETEAVGHIWRNGYAAMANVNNIIQYQPDLLKKYPENTDELNRILAEALFIRALLHFELCRVYAQPYNYTNDASHLGMPVVLKTPAANDNLARKSVKEVYSQIIKDLELSINKFGESEDRGAYYVSKKAAKALLCRVYLYMDDWDNSIDYATKLIEEVPLTYGEDYLRMFNEMEVGEESIFRINGYNKRFSNAKFYYEKNAVPADTLMSLFDNDADLRLQLLQNKDGEKACNKYAVTLDVSELEKHYDPFVLRVSEMYLNRAEAFLNNGMLKEAAKDVKQIMARALGVGIEEITIDELDKDELGRLIEKERAKELCFEGHQFFDITRRKQDLVREVSTNSNVRFIPYPSDLFVLPIPQKELEANTNMQPNSTVN